MKKYFLFALLAISSISFISCEEELSTNTPAFQAMNNYTFWRAENVTANVDKGNLVIVGATETENVTIYINAYELGEEYILGTDDNCTVVYTKKVEDVTYTYKAATGMGSGFIKLNTADKQVPGTISGTFLMELKPVGESLPQSPTVYFHKGVIYEVPLTTKTSTTAIP